MSYTGPQNQGMPGSAAVAHLESFHEGKFDKEAMRALKSIFAGAST